MLRAEFDGESDVDVLVTFESEGSVRLRDLLDMGDQRKAVFGPPVDLTKRRLIEESRNWIRRKSIRNTA